MTTVPASSFTIRPVVRALVGPITDFWLVGGLSLAFLAFAYALKVMQVSLPMFDIGWWAFYMAFAINNPHFAHSYQIFYDRFIRRLTDRSTSVVSRLRMGVAGIVVPVVLCGYFLTAYRFESVFMMGNAVAAMYFFVGWHYVKQGYGVLITLSVYKGLYYTAWEKRILMVNAYAVWLYGWARTKGIVVNHMFYDMTYELGAVPPVVTDALFSVAVVTGLLAAGVIGLAWLYDRRGLSVNGVTGYVSAAYVWVIFPYVTPLFLLFVPLFHSLQYLPFVWKYKAGQINGGRAPSERPTARAFWPKFAVFVGTGVLLGMVFMDWLPKHADRLHGALPFTHNFFLIAALLFINIHHYFIDHAFWRRDNGDVQRYVFDK